VTEKAQSSFDIYNESLSRLEAGKGDQRDEVLVSLWKSSKKLVIDRKALREELKKFEKSVADYYNKTDILETKLAMLLGQDIGEEELFPPTAH